MPSNAYGPEEEQEDRYNVEAVGRFGRICALFTEERTALTAREIANLIDTPLRTVNKILGTLEHHKFLMRSENPDAFTLGFAWLRFASPLEDPPDIRKVARPIMRRLRDQINETVILTVRVGDMRVNIDYAESTHSLRRVAQRNSEKPLHVGSGGRTLLAGLSDAEVAAYFSRVRLVNIGYNTPIDADQIWQDIHAIRAQGYFILTNEITEGGASVSVPLKDYLGQTLAALTIGGPLSRFNQQRRQESLPSMLEATKAFLFDAD